MSKARWNGTGTAASPTVFLDKLSRSGMFPDLVQRIGGSLSICFLVLLWHGERQTIQLCQHDRRILYKTAT